MPLSTHDRTALVLPRKPKKLVACNAPKEAMTFNAVRTGHTTETGALDAPLAILNAHPYQPSTCPGSAPSSNYTEQVEKTMH